MATVPTGLQICVKVLTNASLQGVEWPPWLQPEMNVTFKLASLNVLKFMAASFGFEYFHYSGPLCPQGCKLCVKVLQMPFTGGGGPPWLQPKMNVTF